MIGRFETFTLALSEISANWNKIAAEELKPFDLKGSYVVYLIALYKNPDGLTAANLCEMCNKDKAEVSRAIGIMEKRGIVCRDSSSSNGYRALISLTQEGRIATKALRERVKLAVEKGGEGLNEEQRENFYNALAIISSNLKEISKRGVMIVNIFKKVFCRVYQFGFHLALPLLPYREPVILDSVELIGAQLKKLNISTALIITDEYMKKSGATQVLEASLEQCGIDFFVYDQTRPNPTVSNIEEALHMYNANKCKCLIGFGGGSAIDCAKTVGARAVYPRRNLDKIKGNLKIFRRLPPMFAVPTTAGTGSEVTLTAVVTDVDRKHKYTINAFPLIPSHAVLDARVTYTLPPHLTATTGMDALTHAVEAYIGRSTSRETRELSKQAVKLVFDNIETAYNQPENYEARRNMLVAAYKAGIAFSKSYVGYVHAVAHSLGGQYNVPHGLANTVLLPIVLEDYGKVIYKKLYQLAVYADVADSCDTYETAAKKFIEKVKSLNHNMNVPKTIDGIKEQDICIMAKHADKEGNPLYPVPILKDAKELEKYYYALADWS